MSKSKEQPDMRVLKTATCKTLSGKSTLTYRIGVTPDSTLHLRIAGNTGGGFFSDEWIPFEAVQEALQDDAEGAAITSIRLTPLFKDKSVNTPSFLLATLKHLKLVRSMQGKRRHHERLPASGSVCPPLRPFPAQTYCGPGCPPRLTNAACICRSMDDSVSQIHNTMFHNILAS